MARVKVTVVKRCNCNDLFPDGPPVAYADKLQEGPQCPVFKEGQEFIIDDAHAVPEGFCAWAHANIHTLTMHLFMGGSCDWANPRTATLACCTDGFRPVIFKLERIED